MTDENVKKYKDVIALIKVLANSKKLYLSEKEILMTLSRKASFYKNWINVAKDYPTFFVSKREKTNFFSRKIEWKISLLDRATKIENKFSTPLTPNETTSLINRIKDEFNYLEVISNITPFEAINKTIGDISQKSRIWMNELSTGNLDKVMVELEDYLNQNKQLSVSCLTSFLLVKTRYTKLLKEEKKVEAMINHPKYIALKENVERNTSRINVAIFNILENLPMYEKLK